MLPAVTHGLYGFLFQRNTSHSTERDLSMLQTSPSSRMWGRKLEFWSTASQRCHSFRRRTSLGNPQSSRTRLQTPENARRNTHQHTPGIYVLLKGYVLELRQSSYPSAIKAANCALDFRSCNSRSTEKAKQCLPNWNPLHQSTAISRSGSERSSARGLSASLVFPMGILFVALWIPSAATSRSVATLQRVAWPTSRRSTGLCVAL